MSIPTLVNYKGKTWRTQTRRDGNILLTWTSRNADGEEVHDLISPEVFAIYLRDGFLTPFATTLQRYGDFRPTGFDPAGAFLPDQQDWLVAPVSRTRDSGPLDQSNFETALEMLGGEGDDVEVHRFGHWGPGWFEIIIVRPDSPAVAIAEDILRSLENYPVLDESDFCEREHEDEMESWNSWGYKDFVRSLVKDYELRDSTRDFLEDVPNDTLYELFHEHGGSCEHHSDGPHFRYGDFDASREELARFIREQRKIQQQTV